MPNPSLESFRRTVTEAWPKKQDADARKHLIKVASDGHDRIMREQTVRAGYAPDWSAYANRPGHPISSVVLPGPIVFNYRYHREIADQVLRALREASPVVKGDYVRGHSLYVNRVATDTLPKDFKVSDEVVISNPIPYARRIEIGRTKSGRPFVIQVPDRIYERVAKGPLARRYAKVARLRFVYLDLSGYVSKGKLSATYGRIGAGGLLSQIKRRQRAGTRVMAPAIFIEVI